MRDVVSGGRPTRSSTGSRRSSTRTASPSSHAARRRSPARGPSGRSRSSTTACSCTAASTCSGATDGRALVVDYKSNALDGARRRRRSSRPSTALQRLVYALACLRAGATEVEVVYQFLERPDEVVSTTFTRGRRRRRSRRSCRRRSRASARASSGRRRASSPARAARRSTSSAPGRGCRSSRAVASPRAGRGALRHPREPAGARGRARRGRARGRRRDRRRRRHASRARCRRRSSTASQRVPARGSSAATPTGVLERHDEHGADWVVERERLGDERLAASPRGR